MKNSLLCALLASALLAVAACAKVSVTDSHTYPLPATGAISLKNINGEVIISAWDKNEVSVDTERTGQTQDDVDRTRVTAALKGDELVIATELEKKGFWGGVNSSVRYQLHVPAGVTLDRISTVNGSIRVIAVQGPMTLATTNGSVHATGVVNDATLATTNGSVAAEVDAVQAIRELTLKTVNGSAALSLPTGAPAQIDARTVNGHVSIAQAITLAKSSARAISGQIGQGGPAVDIRTVNGRITINEK